MVLVDVPSAALGWAWRRRLRRWESERRNRSLGRDEDNEDVVFNALINIDYYISIHINAI